MQNYHGDIFIPTPVGNYNPDWAISFEEGSVKYIYFVAETKGIMSSLQTRKIEDIKIDCAREFFKKLVQIAWSTIKLIAMIIYYQWLGGN